jgi:hypothetical protein
MIIISTHRKSNENKKLILYYSIYFLHKCRQMIEKYLRVLLLLAFD